MFITQEKASSCENICSLLHKTFMVGGSDCDCTSWPVLLIFLM